jgi:hypothetical protein
MLLAFSEASGFFRPWVLAGFVFFLPPGDRQRWRS